MARLKRMTWYRTATRIFEADFGDDLTDVDAGTTAALTGTPVVTLEQYVNGMWVDRTSEVTISGETILDGASSGVTNGAVRWKVDGVALDASNPEADTRYRWRVDVSRDDGQEAGVPVILLTIEP